MSACASIAASRLHLVDTTMFWNPSGGGGVRRYVLAKREALQRQGCWRPHDRGSRRARRRRLTAVVLRSRVPVAIGCRGVAAPRHA
jgi:hypothetical protein